MVCVHHSGCSIEQLQPSEHPCWSCRQQVMMLAARVWESEPKQQWSMAGLTALHLLCAGYVGIG